MTRILENVFFKHLLKPHQQDFEMNKNYQMLNIQENQKKKIS